MIAPGTKRKYWEIEKDDQERNLKNMEKENKEKDKVINELTNMIDKFEEEKLAFQENEEKL